MSRRAIVAGGGVGGLCAALALARSGWSVQVLEAAPRLGEIGAGVTLPPNAMKGLACLGLSETVAAAGVEPLRQRIQHWRDGRTLAAFERGPAVRERYGAPYVYVHRADLHAILVEALERAGVRPRLDAVVEHARVRDGRAVATLAGGETAKADLLVGADGLKSAVRRMFEPAAPHFTGHVVWRALLEVEGPVLTDLAAYPGIHIGPGRMAVRYPVRGGRTLNVVFFARQDGWAEEGWTIPAEPREVQALFDGWAPEVGAMAAALDPAQLNRWAVYARQPLEGWNRGGAVTLLGDAAHAMTPFLGQGAACAIEDAVVLARALAAGSIADGLARYEGARLARTAFIQAESNANADRLQGAETDLFGLAKLRNEETLGLFEYDAGTAPV